MAVEAVRQACFALWARAWVRGIALLAVGLCAWGGVVHPGYVNLDTPWLVVDNPLLSSGDLGALPAILWGMDVGTRLTLGAEYLPVRDLTVLADFALFGPRFAWHHAQNLAWYLVGCLLFWRLAERLVPDRAAAWLAAALFLLHPLHVESVAWLAGRKDVVSLTFLLLAVLAWLTGRGRGTGAVIACAALAFWSKSTAIVLPGLLVALSLGTLRERPDRPRWWLQWLPLAAVTGLALGVALVLGREVSMYAPLRGGSHAAALLLETRVLLRYLGMLVWPARLSVVYPEPAPQPLLHPASLAGLAGVLALAALILALWRRRPLAAFGLVWFVVTLLPVSQVLPIQNLIADRYLLVPSAGAALVVADLLQASAARLGPWPRLAVLAGCLAFGVATRARIPAWRDSVALWTSALAAWPESDRIRRNLAGALQDAGRTGEAVAVLTEGLARPGAHPNLDAGLGVILLGLRRDAEAEVLLRRAWEQDDGQRQAGANLLSLLVRQERAEEAVALGERLTRVHPQYPVAWNNLGSALLAAAHTDDAARAFTRAAALDPWYASPACNLALVAFQRGEADARSRWAERCLALDPGNSLALDLLGPRTSVDRPGGTP